jgi:histidyl-tRNA synthetase
VQVVVEILTDLKLGAFEVKLNHRGILDAMLEIAGMNCMTTSCVERKSNAVYILPSVKCATVSC